MRHESIFDFPFIEVYNRIRQGAYRQINRFANQKNEQYVKM